MDEPDPMDEPMRRQCAATSKQSGRRCQRAPAIGQTTCHYHGAASPQAKRSAQERLRELLDPALSGLEKALASDDLAAVVRSAQLILDRCGFHPTRKLELEDTTPAPRLIDVSMLEEREVSLLVAIGKRAEARARGAAPTTPLPPLPALEPDVVTL